MIKAALFDSLRMPFVIEPESVQSERGAPETLFAVCRQKKEFLIENLHRCGALLFRGFGISTEADLERFAAEF